MTGKIKKRRRRSYPHRRTGRTYRVYGIGICPITPTRIRGRDGGRDRHALQFFWGNLLGQLPDDMTLTYHYQRPAESSLI